MKPILQALVIADHIYEDKATRKKVISGTFNKFIIVKTQSDPLPAGEALPKSPVSVVGMRAGSPWAYVSLTDIKGSATMILRYVDLTTNEALLTASLTVTTASPLETAEVVIPLPELPTPHDGTYALELLCEDEPLGSLRLTVETKTAKPPGES